MEMGGAQRVVLDTAAGLDRDRFAVALAWGPGDPLDREARSLDDVRRFEITDLVREVRPAADVRALRELRRAIADIRPHVVHTHSSKAGILGRAAARLEQVPSVVHTIHGWGFTPLQSPPVRAAFFAAERLAARWTDRFVAVSERNRAQGAELGLFEADRCDVIRAGVPLDRFRGRVDDGTVRARLDLPSTAPVVVQVGNFKPQKAPLDFVRVAARVARAVPEARFVMIGDGPLRGAAQELAAELGVADRIVFPGWWDDVAGLLAAASVSLLTSRHEGLPCAVVESLAAGVPVVATAVDGTPEAVHHGHNGLLAAPGDVVALADHVIHVLTEPVMSARLEAAAADGLDEFSTSTMIRRQEEQYAWLAASPRS
jgi:glycosyltransferase involved in cell wall biosynthesis